MNDTTDENNNYVIDSEKQTIILKVETTTVNFSDGNSFTNRDATIRVFEECRQKMILTFQISYTLLKMK